MIAGGRDLRIGAAMGTVDAAHSGPMGTGAPKVRPPSSERA